MDLEKRYFTVLDALPDHVFIFSESGKYVDVYGGEENATGFDCKPFIGQMMQDVMPPEMADEFLSYIQLAITSNQTQTVQYKFDEKTMIELPAEIPTPQEIWFEGTIKPLPMVENGERTVLWMAKNITIRHYLEQRLKAFSETDELTGILNRRAFSKNLKEAMTEYQLFGRMFSILMFDIDRFKRINDSLGHPIGDDVIRHVVSNFRAQLRESDVFGRIGGEEFAVILRDATIDNATDVAEKLRAKLEGQCCDVGNYEVRVTVSIGITSMLDSDTDIKTIMARADKAMYQAKRNGRNSIAVYSHDMDVIDSKLEEQGWITSKLK
ncbi:GGDEF domain-containing protein [Vibrio sp.]|nr:GGDEF domain-containing protein [Vibrio sp.]